MSYGKRLGISVVSLGELKIKMTEFDLIIKVGHSRGGELDGSIDISFLDTEKNKGHLRSVFHSDDPYVAVYETSKEIHLGFGTTLTEGIHASLTLSDSAAEELIKDIQRQLDKRGGT